MMKSNWFLVVLATFAMACSDDGDGNANNTNNTNNSNNTNNVNNSNNGEDMGADMEEPDPLAVCDPLDTAACTLPWPSSLYLAEDSERTTGYTLTFGEHSLPSNEAGSFINPAPYQRMDGYGLGSPAIVNFPNLDSSSLPDEYNVADSLDANSPILFLEITDQAATPIPFYTDHDAWARDEIRKVLIVRPAVILKPNTRYAVAFRNLQTTDGSDIEPNDAFASLVANSAEGELAPRQARFNEVFDAVESVQGWSRGDLILAYDFHTASNDGMHSWILHMRDEALAANPMGPELTITEVEEFTTMENEDTAVRLKGTFEAPNYIVETAVGDDTLKSLRIGQDGLPEAMGTRTVDFWVNIPHSAIGGPAHGLAFYGHGLFGTGERAWASFNSRIANNNDLIFYGASLWGMSETQEENDAGLIIGDLNFFPNIADQLHQGLIEWVLLARSMQSRFSSQEAVNTRNITVNSAENVYTGISQGGIFGPSFVALSPDVTLGHAGVPGHTYAVLLHRSVDFEQFFQVLRAFYKDPIDQTIGLHTIQLLWDSTDSVSYMHRLSAEPFDQGVTNQMIFAPAKGDFQVAVHQNEVLARTEGLGVSLMENYDTERTVDLVTPASYPHVGSAVVLYDFEAGQENGPMFRNAWPDPTNRPPVWGDEEACDAACPVGESIERARFGCCDGACCFDAHELPRRRDWHNDQMVHFFRNNAEVIDVCNGDGCTPD